MHLCIVYKNGETEVIRVKRFSDLSTSNSDYYYYEQDLDDWGKGTTIEKSKILGIEIAPYVKADWPTPTKTTEVETGLGSLEYKDEKGLLQIFGQNTKASLASKDDDPFRKNDYLFCYNGG